MCGDAPAHLAGIWTRDRRTSWEESVTARAMWQGKLAFQSHEIGVRLYSAVLDRNVHFHLLHKRDHARVQQRMVEAETEMPVPLDQTRKAFEAAPGLFVALSSEEIEQTVPAPSREVKISRFVPIEAIDPQLYDRPYYLGPAENSEPDYFALAEALDAKRAGIASWVMRKHSYVGALIGQHGYLMLITLRHAEEVIPVAELAAPQGRPLASKEKDLAEKLIEALAGPFKPHAYHDEYQHRIHELVEAKRAGKKVKPKRAPRRRRTASLADALQASLKNVPPSR
jgi:DNA end-binding protein Ku